MKPLPLIFLSVSLATLPLPAATESPKTETTGASRRVSISEFKAVADGTTLNTVQIQSAIDQLAAQGGGTVVVPEGVFLTGALFLKPKVHLHLEKDAVLRCSTDMNNFPPRRTRIEGHFEDAFNPALINADGCDGLRITGEGMLDGAGRPIWDEFWKRRNAAPDPRNFRNLDVPRARLCLIENSKEIHIQGITFNNSQFWNLHLYKNKGVTVDGVRFQVPDDYKQAPSSDGIDVDSCQDVAISNCSFSVTDDCIAMKGSKGPDALEDQSSPPVERVRVSNCVFKRGHAMMTFGSEATLVRDVVVENCEVVGGMSVLHLKLRPDTPQHYENIRIRGITLDSDKGSVILVSPWTQYFDLKGRPVRHPGQDRGEPESNPDSGHLPHQHRRPAQRAGSENRNHHEPEAREGRGEWKAVHHGFEPLAGIPVHGRLLRLKDAEVIQEARMV